MRALHAPSIQRSTVARQSWFARVAAQDSETYVRNKKKACAEVGIASFGANMPETATEEEVLAVRTAH